MSELGGSEQMHDTPNWPGGQEHALPVSRLRTTWYGMKQRCLNPNHPFFKHYGGRGIGIAPEWVSDSIAFIAYVGPKPTPQHSLDRIDNDGNYEPGNVQWATRSQQGKNRRPRTACKQGHDLADGSPNVYLDKHGDKACIPCMRRRTREYRALDRALDDPVKKNLRNDLRPRRRDSETARSARSDIARRYRGGELGATDAHQELQALGLSARRPEGAA